MMMCVNIPIVNDVICEGQESFTISLVNTDPNVILQPGRSSGTVTIIDDDGKFRQPNDSIIIMYWWCLLHKLHSVLSSCCDWW